MTENHSERAHSEIGASSAHRWMNCPASVSMSRGLPDVKSDYATLGTAAHELSEHCFQEDLEARQCIGMEFEGVEVTEEMASYVQFYLDKMSVYTHSEEYEVYIEEKFELPHIHKDMFGSNDFCAVKKGELVIADFKYGKGISVEAKDNLQLIIYAIGAYHDFADLYDFKTVKLAVVQPRIEGEEWSEWNISVDELLEYEKILKDGVEKVYSDSPPIKSGSHCRFCKAKATCPALRKQAEDLLTQSFDDMNVEETPKLPEVSTLSMEQLSKILTHSSLIEDWLKSVATHAYGLMEAGGKIAGFKLVQRRSNRKIKDEAELKEAFHDTFGDKMYRTSLQTLGALEKLIGKEELAPYLIKPDAGTQLAPITDKRPEVNPSIESSLDLLEENNEDFDTMDF